jgi:hypothetical protein
MVTAAPRIRSRLSRVYVFGDDLKLVAAVLVLREALDAVRPGGPVEKRHKMSGRVAQEVQEGVSGHDCGQLRGRTNDHPALDAELAGDGVFDISRHGIRRRRGGEDGVAAL